MHRLRITCVLLIVCILAAATPCAAQKDLPRAPAGPESKLPEPKPVQPSQALAVPKGAAADFDTFVKAEQLFTARLKSVQAGPVARSMPPIYTHRLALEVKEVLRGDLKGGEEVTAHHQARQQNPPTFPQGELCVVAAQKARQGDALQVIRIRKADDDLLAAAKLAASLPLGWSIQDGKCVSPWAPMGAGAWPTEAKGEPGQLVCSRTGRPALLAGKGVRFEVEPVPPPKEIKWTNPDGDGQYRITVTNTTDAPLRVPALLSDGKKILWNESLVILCQGKARPAPGAKPVGKPPQPTVLKPGEIVTTVVNAFLLDDVQWPRGGYRVEFQFCLGELSQTKSFYYMSRHHDNIRKEAVEKAGK